MRLYAVLLVALLIALGGVLLGLWWAPFIVGVALGVVLPLARVAVPAGAAAGLIAWALPLVAIHGRFGLGTTAESLAAIMGFGHQGLLPVVLTVLVGTLLGATGAWLGSAGRRGLTSART